MLLQLSFLSGLFALGVPEPPVVRAVASILRLQHLGDALDEALRATSGTPVAWQRRTVLLAWGVAGVVVAARLGSSDRPVRGGSGAPRPAGPDGTGQRHVVAGPPAPPD